MKRDLRKLIAEYNQKYSNSNKAIREHLYQTDMVQIFEIAKEMSGKRTNISNSELLFFATMVSWEAGVMIGQKRKR